MELLAASNYYDVSVKGGRYTLIHAGIYHEKLFQALKHRKGEDMDLVLRKLFPEKSKRWDKCPKQLHSYSYSILPRVTLLNIHIINTE